MTETYELRASIALLEARRTALLEEYRRYDLRLSQCAPGSGELLLCDEHCDKLAERIDRLSNQIAQLDNEMWVVDQRIASREAARDRAYGAWRTGA